MSTRRLAYLCLQATTEGQASYAHVHEIIDGLRVCGWEVELFQPEYAGGAAPGVLGRLAEFARVQRKLVAALRTRKFDALYVRGHQLAWPAAREAQRLGIPVVQECNGPFSDFYAVWRRARLIAPLLDASARDQFRKADAVIAVTELLAGWVESETGRPATVVGNGANERLFSPDRRREAPASLPECFAVFFGALSPWQCVDVLVAAVGHPEWPPHLTLVVAGTGVLERQVREAAAEGRVMLTGPLPYEQVGAVVAASLCSFVLKSEDYQTGPSPVKLYESMASGVPVIATDIPGVGELVRRHACGVLIERNTPAAVARAVAGLAADPERAREMGAHGRAAVEEHYSWRVRAAATSAVIESVLRAG